MSSKCKCSPLSSIGKKQIMGVTGLLLCAFLITHFLGNCTLFLSSDAFNKYSHALISNPLIYFAEAGLAVLFLSHIFMGIKLTLENKAARPEEYYMYKQSGRGGTLASNTMIYTGFVTLVFLIIHILGLKYGTQYETNIANIEMRDIYKTVIEYFQSPLHVAIYIFAMITLAFHVSHGLWSGFQSLGMNHPKYMPKIQIASKLFGLAVVIGFSIFPIYCYLQGGH